MSYDFGLDVLGAGPVIGKGGGGGGHGGGGGGGHGGGGHGGGGGRPWRGGGFWPGYGYGYGPADYYFDAPVVELVDEPHDDSSEEDDLIRRLALKALLAEKAKKSVDVLGAFDIQSSQRDMNTLKPVFVRVAQVLLKNGQAAIDHAITLGKQKNLPGGTNRDEVMWKLRWHQDELAKYASTPNAIYGSGDDLKKWTMAALVESNASDEGAGYTDMLWTNMWTEIKQNLAAIPTAVLNVAKQTLDKAETAAKWTLGITVGVVGLAGYLVYKLANSQAGAAVAGAATHAYLGR